MCVIYSDIFLIYGLEYRMEGDGVEPNEFILASVIKYIYGVSKTHLQRV